jgi:hypothetical protein
MSYAERSSEGTRKFLCAIRKIFFEGWNFIPLPEIFKVCFGFRASFLYTIVERTLLLLIFMNYGRQILHTFQIINDLTYSSPNPSYRALVLKGRLRPTMKKLDHHHGI